jgi:hypothetical protein
MSWNPVHVMIQEVDGLVVNHSSLLQLHYQSRYYIPKSSELYKIHLGWAWFRFMVFNATINNISAISWWWVFRSTRLNSGKSQSQLYNESAVTMEKLAVLRAWAEVSNCFLWKYTCTVKPAHAVISIKQSPVLKGHFFLSCHRKFHMNWTSFKRSPIYPKLHSRIIHSLLTTLVSHFSHS